LATAKQIFNRIQSMNATTSEFNGSYVSTNNRQVANMVIGEVIASLPEGTLAHKIATGNTSVFSDKQLWVIAFELLKNAEYVAQVDKLDGRLAERDAQKKVRSAQKRAEQKEAREAIAAAKAGKVVAQEVVMTKPSIRWR
jgi:hypothetical protein